LEHKYNIKISKQDVPKVRKPMKDLNTNTETSLRIISTHTIMRSVIVIVRRLYQ